MKTPEIGDIITFVGTIKKIGKDDNNPIVIVNSVWFENLRASFDECAD